MTIQTLQGSFSSAVWQMVSEMGLKMKKWLTHSRFELQEARAPRHRTSPLYAREHTQRQMQLTLESHHRINTYYASLDKVLSELEARFSAKNDQDILCALGDICHRKAPNN